jgi:hypothetical protein
MTTSRWYRWVDHTAEAQLQVGGGVPGGVDGGGGAGARRPAAAGAGGGAGGRDADDEVSSVDREALLVDWLNG